jgi:hypothetical protein
MRKLLLAGLTALVLLSSCALTDKCKNKKYVYKEGEHPERHMAPKPPVKPTQRDYTFNGPNANHNLTPYTNSVVIPKKQTEVAVIMYPSMANKWIKKIEQPEKVLTAEYDINLKDEFEKGNLKPHNQAIGEDPSLIYIGPEEKRESVWKELGEIFPKASIRDKRFYPLSEDFPGGIPEANKIFNKGLEIIMQKEMQVSGQ